MADPRLVCIGNITIDEAVQPDGTRTHALGGDAVFAALAARRCPVTTEWLAPLGADFPADFAAELVAAGLSLDHLPRRAEATVRNVVTYAADGSRTWELVHGEAHFDRMSVHPADVPEPVLAADGVLVLAMSLAAQLTLTPYLAEHSTATVYLDLQEDHLSGNEAELLVLLTSCDVFLPSEIEAVRLAGTADPVDAARELAAAGPSCVVVKLAERGCLVATGGRVTHVPTDPVIPVDSTGAGDAFCGAFAATHLLTRDPFAAARAGAAAARVAVGGVGVGGLLEGAAS